MLMNLWCICCREWRGGWSPHLTPPLSWKSPLGHNDSNMSIWELESLLPSSTCKVRCFDRQKRPVWETANYPCPSPWRWGMGLEVVCERHLEEFASPTPCKFPVLSISELGFMTSLVFFFNWSIVDLQCYANFRCTAKWFSDTYMYAIFFRFFYLLGYCKAPSKVPCATQ